MFIIECLDSEYNKCFINNIVNNTDEILFFDKEKVIIISNNYIEFVKEKILFFQMLLENNTVDDPTPIIIPIKNINYNDMIFVINFLKIDNDIVNNYFKDLNKTNKNIISVSRENTNGIQNILKDSDIVVLQKNYDYLFWSILAAGTVLVSMNVVKKQ